MLCIIDSMKKLDKQKNKNIGKKGNTIKKSLLDKRKLNKKSLLDKSKLKYEPTKNKPTTNAKAVKKIVASSNKKVKRVNSRGFVVSKFNNIRAYFGSVVKKVSHPKKKSKKVTKLERQKAKIRRNRGIMGIGQLLVVVSIIYSTSIIFIGIDTLGSKIALLPQIIFALIILIKAFFTLYK